MPAPDIVQLIHSAVEKNREIPAVLDAYSEFIDSPIGPLELQSLADVFSRILDNLSQRFPDIASKRAANTANSDISMFLSSANYNVERLKEVLAAELNLVRSSMIASISERFTKMNAEERKAIDATLRLIRKTKVELLFRADLGKQLGSSGKDFERFFALVKSESPGIRELRFENLIVEKGIFNKLILKSKERDYFIWLPSFWAKENADALIQRVSVQTDHLVLTRLRDLALQGKLSALKPFLNELLENLGALTKSQQELPPDLADFFQDVGEYVIIPPIDLDDISAYLSEEKAKEEEARRAQEGKQRMEAQAQKEEQERKVAELRQKLRPANIQVPSGTVAAQPTGIRTEDSVFLGKQLDREQLFSAINRRVQEKDLPSQVKQIGDYYFSLSNLRKKGVAIIGSSGSGRSVTLKRLIDGIGEKPSSPRLVIIDQKGEHRGVAWKYGWKVHGFAADSQAEEFKVSLFLGTRDDEATSLAADLIQDWFNQAGLNCSDQQRERIASIIRGHAVEEKLGLDAIADLLVKDQDLSQLGQKLKRNLVSKSSFSRIFDENTSSAGLALGADTTLFDISGRGLRDPTTKEERQMISVILLKELLSAGIKDSIIVIEDALDRFKSASLKSKTVQIIQKLRNNGNNFIATSRSHIREFLGVECVEFVHRLSGEKIITEEFSEFDSDVPSTILTRVIGFLPRGYVITSRMGGPDGNSLPTSAVNVEPLQFTNMQA